MSNGCFYMVCTILRGSLTTRWAQAPEQWLSEESLHVGDSKALL